MKKGTRTASLAIVVCFLFLFAFCLFRDAGSQIIDFFFFAFNWEVGELWHMTILICEK